MGTDIHPQAIVDTGAELGEDVVVEAFSIVGPKAKIGDGFKYDNIKRCISLISKFSQVKND